MKSKITLLLSFLVTFALPLNAGWFWDDPIEISAQVTRYKLFKDEITFTLRQDVCLTNAKLQLELSYKNKTTTITKTVAKWELYGGVTFKLPDNLTDLKTFCLTGTFSKLTQGTKELKGYKIDSTFDATHLYHAQ